MSRGLYTYFHSSSSKGQGILVVDCDLNKDNLFKGRAIAIWPFCEEDLIAAYTGRELLGYI